ncbi:PREDICTED: uncharacterized protein C5orf52 homolog [Miniopterus natalensis]|uniref:uncharacterized protein C5orf52 homolog n=1 Tax=Miniopterus natalensis TaxID=291302 RepID=UPI0007A6FA71|nr:PREDICTED: uncharacterized protein C5orf52 homolog [Miniopterus natalensis]
MAAFPASLPPPSPSEENAATQQHRPSVTWNLTSPMSKTATARSSTSTAIYPASIVLRRHRLGSSPEINLGTQPQICFLQPRTSQPLVLFSLMNSSEAAVTKFLPKSQLSRVIIRDNLSAQRIYEMETKTSEKTKKKMGHLYDHLKKKFMMDQLRKLGRWRQESTNFRQYLSSIRAFHSKKKSRPP